MTGRVVVISTECNERRDLIRFLDYARNDIKAEGLFIILHGLVMYLRPEQVTTELPNGR